MITVSWKIMSTLSELVLCINEYRYLQSMSFWYKQNTILKSYPTFIIII